MSGPAIDEQTKLGKAVAGSKVDFAKSGTGLAVRKGAPKPDIGSADAFKKTLLQRQVDRLFDRPERASTSLSVFEKLGIADEIKPKLKQTPSGVFVGTLIANGDSRDRLPADSASWSTSRASTTSARCRAICSG